MNILGLMSGSSMDGLDLAIVEFQWIEKPFKIKWNLLESQTINWDQGFIDFLSDLPASLDFDYSEYEQIFCQEVAKIVKAFLIKSDNAIDCIASHGHTVFHWPGKGKTYQLGDGKKLNQLLNIPVISDFRFQDLKLGGQGAPLAPIADKYLFEGYDYYLNLGGIANLTRANTWTAFDVCPCNQILNHYARELNMTFDEDGKIARKGKLHEKLLTELNDWSYYLQSVPKSLGNHQIRNHFIPLIDSYTLNIEDILHTFCHHIAFQLSMAMPADLFNKKIDRSVFCTGGGVYHLFLMELLRERLNKIGIDISIPENHIVETKEAILMALMGFLKMEAVPNVLASATGASKDHNAGTIHQ